VHLEVVVSEKMENPENSESVLRSGEMELLVLVLLVLDSVELLVSGKKMVGSVWVFAPWVER
jgi:hypothetical protein